MVVLATHVELAVDERKVSAADRADQRLVGQRELLELLLEDLAEHLGRGRELRRRQMLIANHQHRVLDPCIVQRPLRLLIERLRQVDAGHLGAERGSGVSVRISCSAAV